MTDELPPAATSLHYEFVASGVWLKWTPATGSPVTIFVPNRWLGSLARIFAGRIAALVDDGANRDREEGTNAELRS